MARKRRPRRAKAKPYQVFISHATADKWIAMALCEKIESQGATTFRDDRDIDGGDDIPETIRLQIKQSHEMIVLLTPQSVGRQWVVLEVGAAWGWSRKIQIVPILYHVDVDPIPEMIKQKKAINLNDFDQYLAELRNRMVKR
jgi:TIR domain